MNSQIPILLKSVIAFFHPVLMLGTVVGTLYGLYLGIQTRRTRKANGETKKFMVKAKYNQRHHRVGAILLVLWSIGSVIGMAATYVLYNQLFLSPHLVGGLSLVCFASFAVATVPFMQQAEKWARNAHIALIILLVGLSFWQTATGFFIVQEMVQEIFNLA